MGARFQASLEISLLLHSHNLTMSTDGWRLHHSMIRIKDPKASQHFYGELLGMKLVHKMGTQKSASTASLQLHSAYLQHQITLQELFGRLSA